MYKIFELSTRISSPLALAGFILAALFFIFQQIIRREIFPRLSQQLAGTIIITIINRFFLLALVAIFIGTAGWIWTNTGRTSLEGIVYVHNEQNKQDVKSGISISVLQIRGPGRTDEYGRFSIPVTKNDLKEKYTFRISYNNISQLENVYADSTNLQNLELHLYDTLSSKVVQPSISLPDINVSFDDFTQTLPLVSSNPIYQSEKVFCETVKSQLVIKHNQVNNQPILVRTIRVEKENINLSSDEMNNLNYKIDAGKIQGHGIVLVKEYIISFSKNAASGKYLLNSSKAISVNTDNILASQLGTEAFTIQATGSDAFLPLTVNFRARDVGFYKARLVIKYDIANTNKIFTTPWIYLLKK